MVDCPVLILQRGSAMIVSQGRIGPILLHRSTLHAYLRHVLRRIAEHPVSHIQDPLPRT
jgi:hypothetical protein